jgi:hypothetical protein
MKQMAVIAAVEPDAARWRGYLGVPRFLAPVHSGPLVQRTVDQLRARGVTDIVVTSADPRLNGLQGCRVMIPKAPPPCGGFGVAAAMEFWTPGKDVVALSGDTYYSDAGLDAILRGPRNFVWWYGRTGGGGIEKPHYEMWAVTIPESFHKIFREACEKASLASQNGRGATISGWLVYRILNGLQIEAQRLIGPSWTEINDETEDFDYPEEFDAWTRLYPDFGPPDPEEPPSPQQDSAPSGAPPPWVNVVAPHVRIPPAQAPAEPDVKPTPLPPPVVPAEVDYSAVPPSPDVAGVPAEPGGSLKEEARKEKDNGSEAPKEEAKPKEGQKT